MVRDVLLPTFRQCVLPQDWNRVLNLLTARAQHPVMVVAQNGDELLLGCQAARETDLVFDASGEFDFWSSLYAGTQAVEGATYLFDPSSIGDALQVLAQPDLWLRLEYEMRAELLQRDPVALVLDDQALWLLNAGAVKWIKDANIAQLAEVVPSWTRTVQVAPEVSIKLG